MIKGMIHVGISVANLERSLEFYRGLLGMNVIAVERFGGPQYEQILALPGARGRVALLQLPALQIELFEFEFPVARPVETRRPVCDHGISHFCIEVDDLDHEYERLTAAGVSFHCPVIEFDGEVKATYGRDPDGNAFELIQTGTSRPT